MTNEYKEGYDDHSKGLGITDCPYNKDPEKDEWEVGWLSAENDELQSEYYNGDPTQEML